MRNDFTFADEVRGDDYALLVGASPDWCDHFLLVLRDEVERSAACEAALHRLEPDLIGKDRRNAWPGTVLHGRTAEILSYRNSEAVRRALIELANGLYDWVHPDLPEDLSFLRPDGSAWLTTIAHERDSYLSLEASEYAKLVERVPMVAGKLQSGDAHPNA